MTAKGASMAECGEHSGYVHVPVSRTLSFGYVFGMWIPLWFLLGGCVVLILRWANPGETPGHWPDPDPATAVLLLLAMFLPLPLSLVVAIVLGRSFHKEFRIVEPEDPGALPELEVLVRFRGRRIWSCSFPGLRALRYHAESQLFRAREPGFANRQLVGTTVEGETMTVVNTPQTFRVSQDDLATIRSCWRSCWGAIDASGRYILRECFKPCVRYDEGLMPIAVGNGQDYAWGYATEDGSVKVTPQFEDAGRFSSGLAAVRSGGHYGYIDPNGQVRIPFIYDAAGDFDGDVAVVRLTKPDAFNVRFAAIDKDGRKLRQAGSPTDLRPSRFDKDSFDDWDDRDP